ncbi:lipocalin family protein [Hymenobacter rubripertinctus]|uniref:Lipocalin-like domain-containing protein n=1 Tax=Hymenobacter rubripertinctus TaxID=2029981 RepID=A0A418QNX4_9BACT|nr:lipocalin family protein [Hymenobacter rubripertinctus]RIY06740.1 hypothetical protein D0T11_17990 [Hymenobacter rubripertinctus]
MNRLRFLFPLLLVLLLGTVASSCSKDDGALTGSLLKAKLVQKWQLDELSLDGQVTDSGAAIKDRYTLLFRADGTYVQTLMADGTQYTGSWKFNEGDVVTLQLTDHKGNSRQYMVSTLTEKELRYGATNTNGKLQEWRFSSTL